MTATQPAFSAALIAGGRSRRLGQDKCLLTRDGQPLWRRQLSLLEQLQPAELLISGRSDQRYFKDHAASLVTDQWPETGPLGGIASVLQIAKHPLVLVLAVDLPQMTLACLETLLAHAQEKCGAVYQSSQGYEPLAAIYPRTLLPMIIARLEAGQLRLQDLLQTTVEAGQMTPIPVPLESDSAFQNLNTLSDARAAGFLGKPSV